MGLISVYVGDITDPCVATGAKNNTDSCLPRRLTEEFPQGVSSVVLMMALDGQYRSKKLDWACWAVWVTKEEIIDLFAEHLSPSMARIKPDFDNRFYARYVQVLREVHELPDNQEHILVVYESA